MLRQESRCQFRGDERELVSITEPGFGGASTSAPRRVFSGFPVGRRLLAGIGTIDDSARLPSFPVAGTAAITAQAVRRGLEAEGYDAAVARTGEEGFFHLNSEAFDLVVLDWMLPGRDGIEILKAICSFT